MIESIFPDMCPDIYVYAIVGHMSIVRQATIGLQSKRKML
jgi:hypothetical protein